MRLFIVETVRFYNGVETHGAPTAAVEGIRCSLKSMTLVRRVRWERGKHPLLRTTPFLASHGRNEKGHTEMTHQDPRSKASDPVRLSVNLAPDVAEALRSLANRKGVSISEVVRDAIATEKYFNEEQWEGGQILIRDKDGSVKQVVLR